MKVPKATKANPIIYRSRARDVLIQVMVSLPSDVII